MQAQYTDWFTYNHDANAQFIQLLLKTEHHPEKIPQLMSHILNAQAIWLGRMQPGNAPLPSVWQIHNIKEMASINDHLLTGTLSLIEQLQANNGFTEELPYATTKGEQFANRYGDILSHILMHSAYHRGQIALLLRQQNIDPPLSDFIVYKRKG